MKSVQAVLSSLQMTSSHTYISHQLNASRVQPINFTQKFCWKNTESPTHHLQGPDFPPLTRARVPTTYLGQSSHHLPGLEFPPLTRARVPSTQYPATMSPFLLSVHHASKSWRDSPLCIIPGLAMITQGPTSSN